MRRQARRKYHLIEKRDGAKCKFCGKKGSEKTITIEHLQPLAEVGGNDLENLAICREPKQRPQKRVRVVGDQEKSESIVMLAVASDPIFLNGMFTEN